MAAAAGAVLLGGSVALGSIATATPAAASNSCNLYADEPTIGVGNAGPSVRRAQCEVNYDMRYHRGYHAIVEDGIFGSATKAAIQSFQACVGLSTDGIVGPNTWSWLDTYYMESSSC
ncbi:peptidoglycan-binding domain-containing protein [Streptomyces cynarae]|uniref:peptidoglycan-binding domain-containing protein n=1 Tax=Streptomyces cynarae TaxID=2981134 RepID=UPI00406C26C9